GLILTNTTISRDRLSGADTARYGQEAGGVSGAPLTQRSRELVGRVASQTALPIIGVGGIMTPTDAAQMLDAGAALIQIYSGLIYAGPTLVSSINEL
ncbi:MAG: nitronate monooxygenase, partial [Propionibacteriaceae bacterium]